MDLAKQIQILKEENQILKDQCEFWENLYRKDTRELMEERDKFKSELDNMNSNKNSGGLRHV